MPSSNTTFLGKKFFFFLQSQINHWIPLTPIIITKITNINGCSLGTRHYFKLLLSIISFNSLNNLAERNCCYLRFTDEETEGKAMWPLQDVVAVLWNFSILFWLCASLLSRTTHQILSSKQWLPTYTFATAQLLAQSRCLAIFAKLLTAVMKLNEILGDDVFPPYSVLADRRVNT